VLAPASVGLPEPGNLTATPRLVMLERPQYRHESHPTTYTFFTPVL
jgi:hypothetical protein